ncbi:MAG: hypothetical protein JSR39_00525 [Verrucomicrobia bacterium]|nr:hypothetical protein [Verrucomicrobiota bacterium]
MSAYLPTWTGCTQKLSQFKASYIDPYVASIPSKDACLARATQTAQTVASYLPQKGGAAAIARMDQRIQDIQSPSNQDLVTASTRLEVQVQKDSLIQEYSRICGTHFEDPTSQIHQAWANFAREEIAYNSSSLTQFDREHPENTDASLLVSQNFRQFLTLDQQGRDTLQRIVAVGSTINSDPELLNALREEKRVVLERDNALCGAHDADLTAPLPRAKSEYETSLSDGSDPITSAGLLDIYKALQKQHAENVRSVYLIDQMLSAPVTPTATLDAVVAQKIQTAVQPIQLRIAAQQNNVGVDWKQTAIHTMSGVVVPTIAYIYG